MTPDQQARALFAKCKSLSTYEEWIADLMVIIGGTREEAVAEFLGRNK